jgi:hypothetical protein
MKVIVKIIQEWWCSSLRWLAVLVFYAAARCYHSCTRFSGFITVARMWICKPKSSANLSALLLRLLLPRASFDLLTMLCPSAFPLLSRLRPSPARAGWFGWLPARRFMAYFRGGSLLAEDMVWKAGRSASKSMARERGTCFRSSGLSTGVAGAEKFAGTGEC